MTERWLRLRLLLLAGCLSAGLLGLGARLVRVQLVCGAQWRELARLQGEGFQERPAERGRILSAKGTLLAVSVPAFSLYADPARLSDAAAAARAAARLGALDEEALCRRLEGGGRFVWVKRILTPAEETWCRARLGEGFGLREERRRCYPLGRSACHLLGHVDVDERGLAGLELAYDVELTGQPGFALIQRDGRRQRAALEAGVAGRAGWDLELTIDEAIQYILEEEVAALAENWRPRGVVAGILDPADGAVLALACWPTFSPERPAASGSGERTPAFAVNCLEPGSTIKPLVVAAYLEEGLGDETTLFDIHGGCWRTDSGRVIRDAAHGGESAARWPVARILIDSSNVGAAQIGLALGAGLPDWLRAFGLGQRTGSGFPGEQAGRLPRGDSWPTDSRLSVSFGYELLVTPLQLLQAYATLINGGCLVTPHFVGCVRDENGRQVSAFPRRPGRRVLSEETSRTMRRLLARVVAEGTGRSAGSAALAIGGKTGTTHKWEQGGWSATRYFSSFLGFAPVEQPALLALVIVDEPQGGYYGGTVAAPAVGAILRRSLAYLRGAGVETVAAAGGGP